ncbi:MAG: phosphoribosylamine--glycine ligase [Deltaproteobacteria bacterium]|nr:phosphoribosylamine--glycine ligase [Deltaproteobacteria bacterium]
MNILVLGSGGREHALAWKLKKHQHQVFLHPGNDGTLQENIPNFGEATTIEEISLQAQKRNISLVVIGPEALLAQDFATHLRLDGFLVVGPGKEGAQLETSKVFAKQFMAKASLPTAPFKIYSNLNEFNEGIKQGHYPKVLKLDGLAAGKGVVIAQDLSQALNFGESVWKKNLFGASSHKILEESFISGVELSYLGFCDGKHFVPLSSATDFKRVFDGNNGPNTGGMGAISPSPYFNSELEKKISDQVLTPLLHTMRKEKLDFRGILYIGIMIDSDQNPYVLEFNTRFGDPETQVLMLRIEEDLAPILIATARAELDLAAPLKWSSQTGIYVVGAAPGYPEKPALGSPISGLIPTDPNTQIFFSGVKKKNVHLLTDGGRVLGVGALGKDVHTARQRAYQRLEQISWDGMHYRKDIGLTH